MEASAAAHYTSVVTLGIISNVDLGINLNDLCCLDDPSIHDLWKFDRPPPSFNVSYVDVWCAHEQEHEFEEGNLIMYPESFEELTQVASQPVVATLRVCEVVL